MEITNNTHIIWSGLSLTALGILTLLFFSYRSVSRSISADFHRRTEIQQKFESFVAANRTIRLDQVATIEFLQTTSDVNEYFSSPKILILRHEIANYSHCLSDVQRKISDSAPGTQIHITLLDTRRSLLAWFAKTNISVTQLFAVEIHENPTKHDVFNEYIRLVGHFLRV